jgi:Tol biopolymer transport system component
MRKDSTSRATSTGILAVALALAALAPVELGQGYAPNPPRTYRMSVSEPNEQANGDSMIAHWGISSSGTRVAFHSVAELVQIDENDNLDVFVRDLLASATIPVSVATGGGMGNGDSRYASISGDGRHVCFMSAADDLVSGDTNGAEDIFVRDVDALTAPVRVSVASDGAQANDRSSTPTISATGRFVVFESYATNLGGTPVPNGNQLEIYVHDRDLDGNGVFDQPGGVLTLVVSTNSSRTLLGERSSNPTVSADGRLVAFEVRSSLSDLDTNDFIDCYVHDRDSDDDDVFDEPGGEATFLVSLSTSDVAGNGNSARPFLSANGQWVAFMSEASDLIAPGLDTNGDYDAFVYGLASSPQPGVMHRLSEKPGHVQASNPNVQYISISPDGGFVTFDSTAQLLAADTNSWRDVYLYDADQDALTLVSVNRSRQVGNGTSWLPGVSADGRLVSFSSQATNLVPGDTNASQDVFLRELRPLRRRL